MATVSALSTFYPAASKIGDPENRMLQITRLIAKMPTLGAFAYRHQKGAVRLSGQHAVLHRQLLGHVVQDE